MRSFARGSKLWPASRAGRFHELARETLRRAPRQPLEEEVSHAERDLRTGWRDRKDIGKARRVREKTAQGTRPSEAGAGILNGVLLDTDVVIEPLAGKPGGQRARRHAAPVRVPTFCTAVTWAEVYAGLKPGEESATEAFFEARGEVVLDSAAGQAAGRYLVRYADPMGSRCRMPWSQPLPRRRACACGPSTGATTR